MNKCVLHKSGFPKFRCTGFDCDFNPCTISGDECPYGGKEIEGGILDGLVCECNCTRAHNDPYIKEQE